MTEDDHVKICDFGVARELKGEKFDGVRRNKPGKIGACRFRCRAALAQLCLLCSGYMAPEVFSGTDFDGQEVCSKQPLADSKLR